jgi:hypothetical protein
MRLLLILLPLALVFSCSKQPELNSKTLNLIANEATQLLQEIPELQVDFDYRSKPTITGLAPKGVYIKQDGLYIILHSAFVSEEGLFVPREGKLVDVSVGQDPQYKKLSGNVFEYKIKG